MCEISARDARTFRVRPFAHVRSFALGLFPRRRSAMRIFAALRNSARRRVCSNPGGGNFCGWEVSQWEDSHIPGRSFRVRGFALGELALGPFALRRSAGLGSFAMRNGEPRERIFARFGAKLRTKVRRFAGPCEASALPPAKLRADPRPLSARARTRHLRDSSNLLDTTL